LRRRARAVVAQGSRPSQSCLNCCFLMAYRQRRCAR
jgi:hypothetical protein